MEDEKQPGDNEIDVTPIENDDDKSIPDQLRELADRLEDDPDEQLICGVVGVDRHVDGDGDRPAAYGFKFTTDALDALPADKTLATAEVYNEMLIEASLKIGIRDQLAFDPDNVQAARIDLNDILGR